MSNSPSSGTTHRFPLSNATEAYALLLDDSRNGDRPLGTVLESQFSAAQAARRVEIISPGHLRPGSKRLGVSMIGAGEFGGGILIPQLSKLPGVTLRGLCSASGLRAQATGRRYGFAFCTSGLDDLLADPETSAVIVATRHNHHADYAAQVLRSDRIVFVEKPLALSVGQLAVVAREILARPGCTLVGFNRRFAPFAQRLREHFEGRGPLFMNYRVNAGPVDATSWVLAPDEGGGRILGEACLFVDFMAFLAGARPVVLTASALPSRDRAPAQDLQSTIEFGDGSVGQLLYCGCGDPTFSKERIEVFGGGRVGVVDAPGGFVSHSGDPARRHRTKAHFTG